MIPETGPKQARNAAPPRVIRSGLGSLGLVSLTSEALLSATTWLAVHDHKSSEQIRTSDGMMHSGFKEMSQEMVNASRVITLSMSFSFPIRFSTLSH